MGSMGTRGQGRGRWAAVTLLLSCASLAQGPTASVSANEQMARDGLRRQILAHELSEEHAALALAATREIDRTQAGDRIGAAEAFSDRQQHAANIVAIERELGFALRPDARVTDRLAPKATTDVTSHPPPGAAAPGAASHPPAEAASAEAAPAEVASAIAARAAAVGPAPAVHPAPAERPAPAARAVALPTADAAPAWDIYRHAPQARTLPAGALPAGAPPAGLPPAGNRPAWDMFATRAAGEARAGTPEGRAGEIVRPIAVYRAGKIQDDWATTRRGSP